MIYIYDVLINLNEEMFDFYDWEEYDSFLHVRRVPMYKVNTNVIYDFSSKKVKIDDVVLASIKDKTQVFSSRNIEVISYGAVFTDGNNAVMIEFDEKGYSKRKSKFLVNEEMEILDVSKSMKVSNMHYNIINNKVKRNVMLRSEKKQLDLILSELENIKDDREKISYLYYEWFDKSDGENKYEKLVNDLKKSFTSKHLEILDVLNLLTVKK